MKTWMPGHKGVYARLRWATAGHDGSSYFPYPAAPAGAGGGH